MDLINNEAAWLMQKPARFEIKPAPFTAPAADEIVVENKAVAINPIDWITQDLGDIILPWIKYPFIVGSDVAGVVAEVGSAVTRFKVGDRVLGHAAGMDKARNSSAEGAFQRYTIILQNMACPIPDKLEFAQAAVLPLGISTAACGMYQKDQLALKYPQLAPPQSNGETLLVWGGSTSVGSNVIQLAVASGYEVVTTASPKNFDYVKELGASQVFDYKSASAREQIIRALAGRKMAGAFAIGGGSADACVDILSACRGKRFVSMVSPPVTFEDAPNPRTLAWLIPKMTRLVSANIVLMSKALLRGVKVNFLFATSIMANEVSKVIYEDYLPGALAEGRFKAAPEPLIFGEGLASIAGACAAQKKGVSASKLVVTLEK